MNSFEFVREMAKAINDRAPSVNPTAKLIPGTVRAFAPSGTRALPIAEVHIHGDPDEHTIHAQVITGQLDPGDMTVVLFDPPEAAYVWGQAPPSVVGAWTITGDTDFATPNSTSVYTFDGAYVMGHVTVLGSIDSATSGEFRVMRNGVQGGSVALPTSGGSFTASFDVDAGFGSGDELVFEVEVIDASGFSITSFVAELEGVHADDFVFWQGVG